MSIDVDPHTAADLPQSRHLATPIPGPRSQELQQRRADTVAAGVGSTLPVYAEAAHGGILADTDGNRLIDLGSGIAVTSVGNAAPAVADAVHKQVEAFTHTCFMVTGYENYVRVCEELAALTPGTGDKRSVLFNSGAEAVENAVKIARHATGRQAVVVFDHGYHGRTNLTMALTAKAMPYKQGFGPLPAEVYRVPMSYPARDGRAGQQAAHEVLTQIEKQVGRGAVAAVIVEPIQGEGGFIEPAPGFLPAIADWCRDDGALFVADEIQTGFCRTGNWFASEHEGIEPDIITTAKGIAGGLPLAGVTGRAEVMDSVHTGGLGGTYGGNPVACAAALGAIETMRSQRLDQAAQRIGTRLHSRLHTLAEDTPAIFDVRGRGAMTAIEFVHPGTSEPDPDLTTTIAKACHEQGVVVLTCGTYGNVIRLLPPLVIDNSLLDEGMDILADAIATHSS